MAVWLVFTQEILPWALYWGVAVKRNTDEEYDDMWEWMKFQKSEKVNYVPIHLKFNMCAFQEE